MKWMKSCVAPTEALARGNLIWIVVSAIGKCRLRRNRGPVWDMWIEQSENLNWQTTINYGSWTVPEQFCMFLNCSWAVQYVLELLLSCSICSWTRVRLQNGSWASLSTVINDSNTSTSDASRELVLQMLALQMLVKTKSRQVSIERLSRSHGTTLSPTQI